MLSSISLQNYKSYAEKTDISFAPLTVLCGTNSSGKSSILKSTLMMRQTIEDGSPLNKLVFSGPYVDNGYWEDIISSNSQDSNTFTVENTFIVRPIKDHQTADSVVYKELRKLYGFIHEAAQFEIRHKIVVARGNTNQNKVAALMDSNAVIKTEISLSVQDVQGREIPNIAGFISLSKEGNTERRYTLSYKNLPLNGTLVARCNERGCVCYFNNIKLINLYKDGISHEVVEAKSSILSLFSIVSMQYLGIDYITPLRQSPRRHYVISGDVSSVGPAGENTAVLCAKIMNSEKKKTGIPLPFSEDFAVRELTSNNGNRMLLRKCIRAWAEYVGVGQLSTTESKGIVSLEIDGHNISDVGFGVSQVLPIIVQCFCMQENSMLYLEQPEIHLHPKMQMNVADFLLAVATTGRGLVVETHSDHIINRLVRRCVENPELNKFVKILFISKNSEGNSVINEDICIDPYRGLTNCPPDFFDQYGRELQDIMQQGMNNVKAAKNL